MTVFLFRKGYSKTQVENGNAFFSSSLSPTTAFLMWRLEEKHHLCNNKNNFDDQTLMNATFEDYQCAHLLVFVVAIHGDFKPFAADSTVTLGIVITSRSISDGVKVLMLTGLSFSIFSSLRKLKMLTVLRICYLSSHTYLVVTTQVITWIVYGYFFYFFFPCCLFHTYSWSLLELCRCHGWCNSRPFTVWLRR